MSEPSGEDIADALHRRIAETGPMTVADYVAAANAHYYATRDPLGVSGDFTTAPEISQMFGELIGLWFADLWIRTGQPGQVSYVELGPGRGTLAQDALRAMGRLGLTPTIHLVETSPTLRKAQADRLAGAQWHETAATLPSEGPLLVVANEFFDALPAHQYQRRGDQWHELVVDSAGSGFRRLEGPIVPEPAPDLPDGAVFERSPAGLAIAGAIAERLATQGGAALFIDYGHTRTTAGDTLQAVSRHAYADPWARPGAQDLTFHVDFQALGEAAQDGGARVHGPREQGDWLEAMGIQLRAAALAKAQSAQADAIAAARDRLILPNSMGRLFKVLGLTGNGWPEPGAFR